MSQSSLLDTVGTSARPPAVETARIAGWRRRWNCVSTKTFLAGQPSERVRRVVLGLEPDETASTVGLVIAVDDPAMARLRAREAAYDEVDVTNCFSSTSTKTVTFVPRHDRLRHRVATSEALVIERGYLDRCLSGAADVGLDDAVAELHATVDLEVVDVLGDIRHRPPGG